MANPTLGKAYIEVHADTKPFAKELGVEINAIVKAAEPGARKSGQSLGREVAQGAKKGIKKEGPSLWGMVKDIFSRNSRRDRNFFANIGSSIGESLAAGAGQGIKGIGGIFSSIGSSIGNVGAMGPLAPALGILIAGGIPALVGAIAALLNVLGPLVNVVGLLPGLLSVLLAAIIPVVVAFQGFGEAISAVMSGDPEKIAEALKGLTPAARGVVREFQAMLPLWRDLKKVTQENFFKQLTGEWTNFSKRVAPTLTRGFGLIATVMGQLFANLLQMASSPQMIKFFDQLFNSTGSIMNTLGPPLTRLIFAFAEIARASLPTIEKFAASLGTAIDKFATWLLEAVKDGSFQHFLDEFGDALTNLLILARLSWNFIKDLIGSAGEQGMASKMFTTLNTVIADLSEFFKSETGKRGMRDMVTLAGAFLIVLGWVIKALFIWATIFTSILKIIAAIIAGVEKVLELIGILSPTVNHLSNFNPASAAGFQGHAQGVISDKQHMAMISEGNRREAVIPLTDPARARELADASGLTSMLGGGDQQVVVYIGDEQVMARVERQVAKGLKAFGRNMKYGPRPVGA